MELLNQIAQLNLGQKEVRYSFFYINMKVTFCYQKALRFLTATYLFLLTARRLLTSQETRDGYGLFTLTMLSC